MAVLRAPVLRGSVLERCMNQSAIQSVKTCEPDESRNRTTWRGVGGDFWPGRMTRKPAEHKNCPTEAVNLGEMK